MKKEICKTAENLLILHSCTAPGAVIPESEEMKKLLPTCVILSFYASRKKTANASSDRWKIS